MLIVYAGQLVLAGSLRFGAAYTVANNLPTNYYLALNPWLHSDHLHIFQNALLFVIFGAWSERKIGTKQFVTGAIIIGYITNIAPSLLGIGGLGIGASGITNALETYFVLFQLSQYTKATYADPPQYRKAAKHLILFFIVTILVLKSIAEYFGYITPASGVAVGGHFIGVLLGLTWFTARSLNQSVRTKT